MLWEDGLEDAKCEVGTRDAVDDGHDGGGYCCAVPEDEEDAEDSVAKDEDEEDVKALS